MIFYLGTIIRQQSIVLPKEATALISREMFSLPSHYFLTAFMITSVFSLGCSYFETYQMQQIRAMGTTADVAITSLSEEQYEELSRSSLVSVVGVSQRLGSIDTSGMDDALLSITWIDENRMARTPCTNNFGYTRRLSASKK